MAESSFTGVVWVGDVEVDLLTYLAWGPTKELRFAHSARLALQVLVLMGTQAGEVLGWREIGSRLDWPPVGRRQRLVMAVSLLRRSFLMSGSQNVIATVHGKGYLLSLAASGGADA